MISVVLATHNEEANLARCLDSVKLFADEIIISDGESTDRTVEIATKYSAVIIKTTNKQLFHINKQLAMDKARGELILQLDADEVVEKKLAEFIEGIHHKIMAGQPDQLPAAWWIARRNWFLGKFLTKGGQYPDPVIRLYQKGKAVLPQKDVHEQMVVQGEVGWAEGHLLHYSSPTFAIYLRKWNDYTSLKAAQLDAAGEKIEVFSFVEYFLIKPVATFFSLYFRHKGCIDGVAGFVFALYSALFHPFSYLKLWEIRERRKVS